MRPPHSPWKIATIALFALMGFIVLQTFGDYGMSWDEHYRESEGAKKFSYYENLFSGHWAPYDNKEDLYPGFYDLLHQAAVRILPFGDVFTDHLLTALAGLLTVLAAVKIGRRLGGERTGFFSALFLLLFPNFYGHMFINPKDIPFACGYLWSLYVTLKLIDAPRITSWLIAEISLVYGLTLGVRLGGVFFFAFLALAFLLRFFLKLSDIPSVKNSPKASAPGKVSRHPWIQLAARLFSYLGLGALIVAASFLILLPWWPFAHPDPFGSLMHAFDRVGSYPWNGPVLLNGHVYPATDLPWFYLPELLLITTPIFLLILVIAGILLAFISFIKNIFPKKLNYLAAHKLSAFLVAIFLLIPIVAGVYMRAAMFNDSSQRFLLVLWSLAILLVFMITGAIIASIGPIKNAVSQKLAYFTPRRLSILLVAVTFFFPIAAVIYKHATLYDGIRHFLFVLGPLAILCALAVDKLLALVFEHFRRHSASDIRWVKAIAAFAIFVPCGGVALKYVTLHPYQYIFFNSLVGGESKAWVDFDTEYWGTAHREAVEMLVAHLKREGSHKVYRVTSSMAPWLVENFLPANLTYTCNPREADFFVSFLRFNSHMWSDGEIMNDCVVVRGQVPLAIVRDRRKILSSQKQTSPKGHTSLLISRALDLLGM